MGAYSQIKAGEEANSRAHALAKQKRTDALAAQAEAQQEAASERKKMRYTRSRALAVAGASGGGVSDPTINNILTGIETEGEMNALNTLWSGDTTAQGLRAEGRAAIAEGHAAKDAGYLSGFTTAFSGAADFAEAKPTLFEKYGGKKAKPSMASW